MAPIKRATRKPTKKIAAKGKKLPNVKRKTKAINRSEAKAPRRKRVPSSREKSVFQTFIPTTFHADPAVVEMAARVTNCNLAPIKWKQGIDGGWMEASLKSDCTYGNWVAVPSSHVPKIIREG